MEVKFTGLFPAACDFIVFGGVDAALQSFREERNRIRLQQKEVLRIMSLSANHMAIQF